MSEPLHNFYMGALGAEIDNGCGTDFSARMATYHCRTLLALEANPQAGTSDAHVEGPGARAEAANVAR